VPIEPPPSVWHFEPPPVDMDGEIVATGGDLEPGTILAAYRAAQFPMPLDGRVLAWWSPDPRGVLPLDGLKVSRSLRKSCGRYRVTVDASFRDVIAACADRRRPGAWISSPVRKAYVRLHELGWAHSVEAWLPDGTRAGGLYGIAIGGLFAGESMFHRSTDASKVALVALVELLSDGQAGRLLDVQWQTPHLATLGVVEITRAEYHRRLDTALGLPLPAAFS
jgi:leucyl/phenylalanyl-tRNA--protein transferase